MAVYHVPAETETATRPEELGFEVLGSMESDLTRSLWLAEAHWRLRQHRSGGPASGVHSSSFAYAEARCARAVARRRVEAVNLREKAWLCLVE